MARSAGISVNNNLTGGLITETTGLSFPENAAKDVINCVFDKTGKISRRNGFLYEDGFQALVEDKNNKAINSFLWKNVGDSGNRSFYILQIGMIIYFYEVLGPTQSLSSGLLPFTINLNSYYIGGLNPEQVECSFSSGLSYLFITHPNVDPIYVVFSSMSSTFSVSRLTIRIRDLEGVDDGLTLDARPSTLSNPHKYNLYNQGWYQEILNAVGLNAQAIDAWRSDGRTNRGDYPANADVWWYYKGPYMFFTEDIRGSNSEYFRNSLVNTVAIGNSPAPKGHFLLDLHYQDRSGVSGIPGIPVKISYNSRVSCNTFFAGRVFYSGLSGEGFVGKIYFTQIIERREQLGSCYQQMDPTSEGNSDLLPSDGGVISISEAGTILKMQPVGNSLVVWASNGIWAIAGSQGIGFTANDYAVTKISSSSILSAFNFVDVEGIPMWWNQNGIYALTVLDQAGSIEVRSITDEKIKTFIDNIPVESKLYVKGAYNSFTKTIHWLYRSSAPTTITERYTYDRVLVFDTQVGCFYPWVLPPVGPTFHGLIVVDGERNSVEVQQVTSSLGDVVDNVGDPVTVAQTILSPSSGVFKYLTNDTIYLTFAEINNPVHIDWEGRYNTPFTSYVDLAYLVHGEGMRKFQSTYITTFTDNTFMSTFDLLSKWDWSNTGSVGRWSSTQRIYAKPDSYSVSSQRRKLRGHGLALQLRIQSVDSEPFAFIGYSIYETGNQSP